MCVDGISQFLLCNFPNPPVFPSLCRTGSLEPSATPQSSRTESSYSRCPVTIRHCDLEDTELNLNLASAFVASGLDDSVTGVEAVPQNLQSAWVSYVQTRYRRLIFSNYFFSFCSLGERSRYGVHLLPQPEGRSHPCHLVFIQKSASDNGRVVDSYLSPCSWDDVGPGWSLMMP